MRGRCAAGRSASPGRASAARRIVEQVTGVGNLTEINRRPGSLLVDAPARNSRRITIAEATRIVMQQKGRPLSPAEVYGAIVEAGLYKFNTDDPVSIVRSEIRRRCVGLEFASASPKKYFKLTNDGRYTLIPETNVERQEIHPSSPHLLFQQLFTLQQQHEVEVRARVLEALKSLAPLAFERFAERLLRAYGFEDVSITKRSRDGGIDGTGRLSIGLTSINVAFQCKRYLNKPVGREAIDTFRGATSELHEQGFFFTTSRFTVDAIEAQRRPGAMSIALFDGVRIVDIMFKKGFGISFRELKIAELALDEILEME